MSILIRTPQDLRKAGGWSAAAHRRVQTQVGGTAVSDQDLTYAPLGFTKESWATFARDGILIIEDALKPDQIQPLVEALEEQPRGMGWNIVESDPRFAELIDGPAHVGYVYDVYGEMLKLLRSQSFKREPGRQMRVRWHFDGPRALPFEVFGGKAPLRIKVGYWLTALPHADMGNLVYIPGSHRNRPYLSQYHTHDPSQDERHLTVKPGSMTLMWSGLWHRVAENRSEVTRLNLFYEYGPTWIVACDRFRSTPHWASSLSRTRRILMRDYGKPNDAFRPPKEDVPIYVPRPGEPDLEAGRYAEHVPAALRKRSTWLEQQGIL
ncbi:phytanoyl-CoA dioxygenase family protein [Streptomyces rectiverticillatus]|uniref:phytanoyl-CoA dioxygenase family protein n=1 Tax=Streptomyces rectiverticillatus TaxID=173860 RepID=UPI0015C38CAA|nr:phytanoyl-CoA dioxygenase family protein [Streptomyces rectiverticillatus]QLE70305.1 phytanoyl-CoA dioxygenase family protein [Streptomyces rectiverticillatus]